MLVVLISRPGAVLAALVAVAVAWGPPHPAPAATRADRPIGVFSPFNGAGRVFAPLERRALRPGRPRLRLGEHHGNWSFSPDRSRLALGMGGASPSCGRGICIVDVETMRIAGYVPASVAVETVAWLRPRRIVGVLQGGVVIVVDPVAETVVQSRDLPYNNVYAPPVARTSEGLVVLIDANPPRLIRVDADGEVGSLALTRIGRDAGLAAAGRGERVFVVSAGAPVAEVDVRTMDVRYHRVASRPEAGSTEALWLGRGLLGAVSGRGGVQAIDTGTWSARTISRRATRARLAAGRLLLWSEGRLRRRGGVGLRVHTRDGRRLVRHLFGEQELDVEVAGPRAFVFWPGARPSRAAQVVRVSTGELVGSVAPPPRGYEAQILSARLGSGDLPR